MKPLTQALNYLRLQRSSFYWILLLKGVRVIPVIQKCSCVNPYCYRVANIEAFPEQYIDAQGNIATRTKVCCHSSRLKSAGSFLFRMNEWMNEWITLFRLHGQLIRMFNNENWKYHYYHHFLHCKYRYIILILKILGFHLLHIKIHKH